MGRSIRRKDWRRLTKNVRRLIRLGDLKEEDLAEIYDVCIRAAKREKAGLAEEMTMKKLEQDK